MAREGRTRRLVALIAALAATFLWLGEAFAQSDPQQLIAANARALEAVRDDLKADAFEAVSETEGKLRDIRDAARAAIVPLSRDLAAAEADLQSLGPAPAEGAAPESEALAAQRSSIESRIAELRGLEIQLSAQANEATELLGQISARQVGQLYRGALERGSSIVSPEHWTRAFSAAGPVVTKGSAFLENWAAERRESGALALSVATVVGAVVVALLIFGPFNRWVASSVSSRIERLEPNPSRRVVVAGLKMLARVGPGVVGGLIIFLTLRAQGLIVPEGAQIARSAWSALVALLLVNGFVAGLFSSSNPKWRLASLREEQTRKLGAYVVGVVLIFGLKSVLGEIAAATDADPALARVLDAVSAIAIGALLFLICDRRLWAVSSEAPAQQVEAQTGTDKPHGEMWRPVRGAVRLVALTTMAAPFFGYVAFADFVTSRLYLLALLLAVAWFVRAAAREATAWGARRLLSSQGKAAEEGEETKSFDLYWIRAAIDAVFVIALMPAVLVLAGVRWSAVRDLVAQALFGFEVGGVQIPSFAKILIAIGVFIGVLALTRVVQRGVAKGPFAHSRLDPGVQNSLTTLMGYAGFVIALLTGIVALGFDLGSLAIIAGALSVGIGFGLQSIVNNFVSGLILLFERPIKVGDWVVTASGEGIVKKISVRSTEIETFDRSTVIVPNSELISQTVTNWTHRDKIGRIIVPVGVAYESDPQKVTEILLKCAQDHPLVVRYPEPFVVWTAFGVSSLDFELRAYLRDIGTGLGVKTELRHAIFAAFKDAGVEFPFSQQDVYIKSMPEPGAPARSKSRKAPAKAVANTVPDHEPESPEIAEDD